MGTNCGYCTYHVLYEDDLLKVIPEAAGTFFDFVKSNCANLAVEELAKARSDYEFTDYPAPCFEEVSNLFQGMQSAFAAKFPGLVLELSWISDDAPARCDLNDEYVFHVCGTVFEKTKVAIQLEDAIGGTLVYREQYHIWMG